ncbi:uncharacterized protein RAG0_17647 [Rhynchosporium agropyri]|uniref:Uncharacterized protein n=1 Tax=Rhynchosporium agropyri TaxID=914238 RepID=A0A1E1LTY2_9HELO|nr:uncharacterized protein RAG0_17647 [Rhynchosporium agropyri]
MTKIMRIAKQSPMHHFDTKQVVSSRRENAIRKAIGPLSITQRHPYLRLPQLVIPSWTWTTVCDTIHVSTGTTTCDILHSTSLWIYGASIDCSYSDSSV